MYKSEYTHENTANYSYLLDNKCEILYYYVRRTKRQY